MSAQDAEDVTQEVFIKVYQSIATFRGEVKLSTWLYHIAVSESLDFLRRKKRKKRFGHIRKFLGLKEAENEIPVVPSSNPHINLENRERVQMLWQAVDSLTENQKIAIILSKYEGFSYKEIADIMGTTVSSVESLIHRGMKNLRKKLYQYYEKNL